MKDLGALLTLNIGGHYFISTDAYYKELLHAGRLESVTVTDDCIIVTNKLGALYRILNVASWEVISEQEVKITHTDGSSIIIEVRD